MRTRSLVGSVFAAAFVVLVVHASFANQCPASGLGTCARLHAEFMRPRTPAAPVALAAPPMRGATDRG